MQHPPRRHQAGQHPGVLTLSNTSDAVKGVFNVFVSVKGERVEDHSEAVRFRFCFSRC